MPICIECGYPVSQLYHSLHSRDHKPSVPPTRPASKPSAPSLHASFQKNAAGVSKGHAAGVAKAPTSGSGGDVRLTQCPRCKRFADKYVEHDYVVLFIDLVLVKPQVYRHLLFNRLSRHDDELDPSILRLGILLLLFDVYLTWSYIESLPPTLTARSSVPQLPILLQYGFFLFLCATTTLSQHLTVRYLAGAWGLGGPADEDHSKASSPTVDVPSASAPFPTPPKRPTTNSISTALFVSSCMSLFPVLMVVWKYDDSSPSSTPIPINNPTLASTFLSTPGKGVDWVRRGVSWAVAMQNLEALRILLGCGYLAAGGMVAAGGAVRWVVWNAILTLAGLDEGV